MVSLVYLKLKRLTKAYTLNPKPVQGSFGLEVLLGLWGRGGLPVLWVQGVAFWASGVGVGGFRAGHPLRGGFLTKKSK